MKPGDIGTVQYTTSHPVQDGITFHHEAKIRLLVISDQLTFYDQWIDDGNWSLWRRRTFAYSRYGTDWLAAHAEFTGHEPLTDKEVGIHRADWPMNAFSLTEYPRNTMETKDLEDFEAFCVANRHPADELSSFDGIDAKELVISAPNSGLGLHKPVTVVAVNGKHFSAMELLWHSQRYVRQLGTPLENDGIGLYRLGIKNKLPWYMLGGRSNPALPE